MRFSHAYKFYRTLAVPVYMSKNVIGAVILIIAFGGNLNFQVLSTYLRRSEADGFNYIFYSLCGPAQIASIVGIMTGTIVQIYFNPRLVTSTPALFIASVANWIVVFVLEGFVFPLTNIETAHTCSLPTSTNCMIYKAIS